MSLTVAGAAEHQRRRHALAACRLDPELQMVRGTSYANEVWLGYDVVLRVNHHNVGRLAREAAIAKRLSPEARYPEILVVGNDGEIEWMLARRVAGVELGRAWKRMLPNERERAIHELAHALAAVHATPCEGIPEDDIDPPHTLPFVPLRQLLAKAQLDRGLRDALAALIDAKWPAFDHADRGLVHGDPHFENVLWDGEHVSALLDFEWSRPSWIHVDLEILLSLSGDPALFASADYAHAIDPENYREILRWLEAARPEWFAHPRLTDRLAVLHVSRTLGHIVEDGPSELRIEHLRTILDQA